MSASGVFSREHVSRWFVSDVVDRKCPKSTTSYHGPQSGVPGREESGESHRRARADRLVGSVLVDRFQLLELIGAGAFGEVYKASDRHNPNTPLAVKVLGRQSAQALYQFKREFRALGEWSHQNLVALHELFLDGEVAFFTMELVLGIDFFSYVRPGGVLQPDRLSGALTGLCDGLSALHARGYVHRDLKPSNVLVEPDGRVVIVDLGLATLFGQGAWGGSELGFTGTVHYAAPEQLALGAVGPEADWYAVGTMLHEALSGELPYQAPVAELFQEKSRPPPLLALEGEPLLPLATAARLLLQPDTSLRGGAAVLRTALGQEKALPAVAPELALVGRRAQLDTLEAMFSEVERGACVVALIEASSGLGKTTLVEAFVQELRYQHRATVLRGRCYVNEEVTYQALDGSIDALSHHLRSLPPAQVAALLPRDVRSLAQLFPVLHRVESIVLAPSVRSLEDKASLRDRAGAALRELIGRLSDRLPVVLFIDDIQWDDADSAWLLSRVLSAPDPPALMVIATCRSETRAQSQLLRQLEANPSTQRLVHSIELPALTPEETVTLALGAMPDASDQPGLAQRVALESAGHPLFALELARFVHAGVEPARAAARLSLDEALWTRAQKLTPAALRLLKILCVAGHPLELLVATAAAGCEADALRELALAKLLTSSGFSTEDTLSVYHDRVREAVLFNLPGTEVEQLHATLAAALAADEQRFDLIVEHYLASGQRDKAAQFALRAADHASSVLAFHRLPALLLLAITAAPSEQQGQLYLRLAEAYGLLGRSLDAAQAYEDAARLEPDPEQRWERLSLAMWQAFHAQDLVRGHALLADLEEKLGRSGIRPTFWRLLLSLFRGTSWLLLGPPTLRAPSAPTPQRALEEKRMRLAFRAATSLVRGQLALAFYLATQAFHAAARLGDVGVYSALLAMFVVARSMRTGRPSEAQERLLARATELSQAQPDAGTRLLVEASHVAYAFSSGQQERAERGLLPLLDADFPVTPFGTFLRSLILYTLGMQVLFWSGRVAQLQIFGPRVIAWARELADPNLEFGLRAQVAFRFLANDEVESAWSEWSGTLERYPFHDSLRPSTFGVLVALYNDRFDRAEQVLSVSWRLVIRSDLYLIPVRDLYLWWWAGVAAARLAHGEKGLGLRLRVWLASFLISLRPPPASVAFVACLRALRAFRAGQRQRGVAQLQLAQAEFAASGRRLFAAAASYLLATLHPDAAERARHAEGARAAFEAEKIMRPERWAHALLPGFPRVRDP